MDVSSAQAAAKRAVEILVELIPEAKYAALEGIGPSTRLSRASS